MKKEIIQILDGIETFKRFVRVIFGNDDVFTIAKILRYFFRFSEYKALLGAIALEEIEKTCRAFLNEILENEFEEFSNHYGE